MSKFIQQIVELVTAPGEHRFSVRFIKRSDGTLREMKCQTGVKRDLVENPRSKPPAPKDHNMLRVFDLEANGGEGGWRSVPLEGLKEVMLFGEWEGVNHDRWYLKGYDNDTNTLTVVSLGVTGWIYCMQTSEWDLIAKLATAGGYVVGDFHASNESIHNVQLVPLPFDLYGRVKRNGAGQ